MRLQSIEDVVNRRNSRINMRNCRNVSACFGHNRGRFDVNGSSETPFDYDNSNCQ